MLTVDLVQSWRKKDRLFIRPLKKAKKERARSIAGAYIEIAKSHSNLSREEFDARCAAVEVNVQDRKLAAGLLKLVLDRCVFEMEADVDPVALREAIFKEASCQRQAAEGAADFDRCKVLAEAGKRLGLSKEEADNLLFADLKGAHRLDSFDPIAADQLIELYERSQGQAVLLKATYVSVIVQTDLVVSLRRLFHKLKFLGLIYVIQPENGGYRIDIDGPFSIFRQVTKYGMKLAMLLPALDECGIWKLDAEVLWGKNKQRLKFHLESGSQPVIPQKSPRLADEVATLAERFQALEIEWSVTPGTDILDLPGEGLCIPDLTFVHRTTGELVHLEVLGFWSRDAVWKRVELVEAGLPHRIIFAVSERLRVSEKVLGDDLPGSLYVYKGVMNAGRIAQLLSDKYSNGMKMAME